jgi:glycosyltransferase involved in cell wall biosynthesis
MPDALRAQLQSSLPRSLPVGCGSAIFLAGTCEHAGDLTLLLNGAPHPLGASGMRRHDAAGDGGFWATLPIPPQGSAGEIEIELASGNRRAQLGRIPIVQPAPPPAYKGFGGPETIAICMATYNPDPVLFRVQIESIREQSDTRWFCLVSDDASDAEHFEQLREVLDDDPRFAVSRSDERRGFYRNFERALQMLPGEARLVALCDQDDRWHPDKLATLRGALGAAQLVYSDQRLTDPEGRVLRNTMWEGRSNNHTDLASMLVANTITGAAALFRREVADLMLPFPQPPGIQFHDHWLALVALATGDLNYVERPLYDYVQHRGAVFGDVTRPGDERARTRLRDTLTKWRAAYFHGYLAREVQVQALLARAGDKISAPKRRVLERFDAAERSPLAWAWLAARPLRAVGGRNETLGSELELAEGILWSRLARIPGPRRLEASAPDPIAFEQKRLRRWRARV